MTADAVVLALWKHLPQPERRAQALAETVSRKTGHYETSLTEELALDPIGALAGLTTSTYRGRGLRLIASPAMLRQLAKNAVIDALNTYAQTHWAKSAGEPWQYAWLEAIDRVAAARLACAAARTTLRYVRFIDPSLVHALGVAEAWTRGQAPDDRVDAVLARIDIGRDEDAVGRETEGDALFSVFSAVKTAARSHWSDVPDVAPSYDAVCFAASAHAAIEGGRPSVRRRWIEDFGERLPEKAPVLA